jgi:short subunit dehydrogenase-like uncharacterized protein
VSAWLLYGANGYTGRRIAREAVRRGLRPILAGRDRRKIEPLANELQCEGRAFELVDPAHAARHLDGVQVVLNCAGPFVKTSRTMIAACLAAKASYLDITGEIDAIEHAAGCDAAAREAGVSIIPSVGFDVVPTDCLAAMLGDALHDATHLALAFTGSAHTSPGTTKTIVQGLPFGGKARVDGRIETVPFAWKRRNIPFHSGMREAVTIPWGDVSSAFYTTGIPNIETYMALEEVGAKSMRRLRKIAPLLKFKPVMNLTQRLIGKFVKGPTEEQMRTERTSLWGEVRNAAGRVVTATMETPNGYALTIDTALAAVERVLRNDVAPGVHTPARALGTAFVL